MIWSRGNDGIGCWVHNGDELGTRSRAAPGVVILLLFPLKIEAVEARGRPCPQAQAVVSLAAMKADRKRLKGEKTDLVSQMQQLYATLESREEQLRDFIRNYEQHRKVSVRAQHWAGVAVAWG